MAWGDKLAQGRTSERNDAPAARSEPLPNLFPDGRRWREAPDEGLPLPQKAAAAPLRPHAGRAVPHPCPSPLISGLPEISTQSVEVG